jgi:hypothetical protein
MNLVVEQHHLPGVVQLRLGYGFRGGECHKDILIKNRSGTQRGENASKNKLPLGPAIVGSVETMRTNSSVKLSTRSAEVSQPPI